MARPRTPQREPQGPLAANPRELLRNFDSFTVKMGDAQPERFVESLGARPFEDLRTRVDTMLAEATRKGYQIAGQPLPASWERLDSVSGASFDVELKLRDSSGRVAIGSFQFDHEDGSRGYLDVNLRLDRGREQQSFSSLTLTNVWSDQPEVVRRSAAQTHKFNDEARFFVDVTLVEPEPRPILLWYHYWWYDSHHHPWWWYGPYWWWWRRYKWFGYSWWWWWNWWWPWWHWYHWWGWSAWWADLIAGPPVRSRLS